MQIEAVNGTLSYPVSFQYKAFKDYEQLPEDEILLNEIQEFLLNNSCMHIVQLRSYAYLTVFMYRKKNRRKISVPDIERKTEELISKLRYSGMINEINNIVYPHRKTGNDLSQIHFRAEDMMAVWFQIYLKYAFYIKPQAVVRKPYPSQYEDLEYVVDNTIHSVKVVPWKEMFDGDELEPHKRIIQHFTDIDEAYRSIIPGYSSYVRETTAGLKHDYIFRSVEQLEQFKLISERAEKNWHEKRNTRFFVIDMESTKGQYPIPKFELID